MLFSEGFDEASRIADLALDRMKAEGIPPTPDNFTVWFAYFSGRFPELARTIDIIATNRQPFTPQSSAGLYQQFFSLDTESDTVQTVATKLQAALENVTRALTDADSGVGRYEAALTAAGTGLQISATLEQMRDLIQAVSAETARMAVRTRTLQSQLSDSVCQIEAMRRDLDSVRREASIDALTEIANRKHFDHALRLACTHAMEVDDPLCLLMVDIDHFKRFNDTHGHVVGDQVLKLVARTLTACTRATDIPARFGGEEFAIILPGTRIRDAVAVAERIRTTIAGREVKKRATGEALGSITLSLGLAQYRLGEPLTRLIQRADAALYQAKNGGRNLLMSDAEDIAGADG